MASEDATTMRVWQYSSTAGGMENNMKLVTAPVPTPKPDQHLIRVSAVGLNPVDYKLSETPFVGRFAAPRPATPGIDIAGEIVIPAAGSGLKRGQLVCGAAGGTLAAAGGLAEMVVAPKDQIVAVPAGVSPSDAASLPVVAITACQTLMPFVKSGDHVLYNGGSGGVGLVAIQVAKILGCHITVTCSSRNADLCRSLGADEVVEYTSTDVIAALKKLPYKFDHIIDGVGGDTRLYWQCHHYTNPKAKIVYIALDLPKDAPFLFTALALPTWLGGQSRQLVPLFGRFEVDDMQRIAAWVAEGRVKACLDSRFAFERAPEAFRKLRTRRATGKIIVDVLSKEGDNGSRTN